MTIRRIEPGPGQESVWDYPRPPRVEESSRLIQVRFNGETEKRHFTPSATVERVKRWAARRAFHLSPRDAAEHVLQIKGTTTRPDRDVHVGTLTHGHSCAVAFDLVPSQRVEG